MLTVDLLQHCGLHHGNTKFHRNTKNENLRVFVAFRGFVVICFLLVPIVLGQDWQELKSEHFIIYYPQDGKFAKEVLDKAEEYYQKIADDLGYPRHSEFWTWDKRVKIYLYPDHSSFLKATAQPTWSQGMADYTNKKIVSYIWSHGFLESLLPHEMAHLIFRDFVGFKGEVPLWLDEGIAQWEEETKRIESKRMAKQLLNQNEFIPLEEMMKLDVRKIKEEDNVSIHSIPITFSGKNLVTVYYIQAVSLVDFLVERYGTSDFVHFCRQLRDGKTLEEGLRFAYPTSIQNIEELEEKWKEYLRGPTANKEVE